MDMTLPNRYTSVKHEYTNTAVVTDYRSGNLVNMHKKPNYNNIEKLRKRLGLTRPQLADRLNTTETTIYRKERGDRGLTDKEITLYAKALRCSPEELVGNKEMKPLPEEAPADNLEDSALMNEMMKRISELERVVMKLAAEIAHRTPPINFNRKKSDNKA
jgi:transcriptional regulator with XRE-family HTH domain